MVLRELDLLARQVALGVARTAGRTRISSELSGVRSSCDMFARNSDLYFEVSASCARLLLERLARLLDLLVLALHLLVLVRQQPRLLLQLLVGRCSSSWRLCSSCASACDCVSRSSVRMLASIVLITMPIDSVSWSRNAWWVSLKPLERSQLEHALHLAFEHHRQHEDVARRRAAQARRDAHVVVRRVVEQDLALLERALADQALAQADAAAMGRLAIGRVARQQREVRRVLAAGRARRTPRAAR